MATIGIIGAGNIGSNVARAALAHGYDVVISNSRGPETLTELIQELGPRATAATVSEAVQAGDLVLVAIPLKNIGDLDPALLAGKIVIDANNYYPQRDGRIPQLEDESTTTSQLLQTHLVDSKVVKAFNHIRAPEIVADAQPAGTAERRALIVAADDPAARQAVTSFINEIGFEVVDLGELAEGWRIQRDTPGYVAQRTASQLREDLAAARRYRDM